MPDMNPSHTNFSREINGELGKKYNSKLD